MSPASRTLLCVLWAACSLNASATVGEKVDAAASAASGVAQTVHKAVVRGVKAAASGVERGARGGGGCGRQGRLASSTHPKPAPPPLPADRGWPHRGGFRLPSCPCRPRDRTRLPVGGTCPRRPLRQLLLAHVRSLTGQSSRLADFTQPVGDPGWFGPDSASWTVHADFVAMLTGGVRALLMQCLHPLGPGRRLGSFQFPCGPARTPANARPCSWPAPPTGPTALADAAVHRVRTIPRASARPGA